MTPMKKYFKHIVMFMFLISVLGCKKDAEPQYIQLDVPFYMSINQECILIDTRIDSLTGNSVEHKLSLKCTSVIDERCFESVGSGILGCCAQSSGGAAEIFLRIEEDESDSQAFSFFMPGCRQSDEEYSLINTNIPKYIYHGYKVCLLMLKPWDSKPKNSAYSVKCILKRN